MGNKSKKQAMEVLSKLPGKKVEDSNKAKVLSCIIC
jgi:hypothetical protein